MEDYFWITVPKKLKEFRLRFNVYDQDDDGIITVNELLTVLREMGQNVTKADLKEMMRAVELGSKHDIHFDEFLMMVANKEACEENVQEVKEAFKVFDNGKGYISVRDLRTIMLSMGERLTDEEVDEMIQEATVKDGNIKISDFITVLCR
ncbi:calmodulin-A-like isoform X2 [Mercenaria mercenaria]|uniref:calmodulin-A-like isoform X2 n=1 Tax=Mercenaria mercenaria TaxID=6596 RepID=UPI00234EAF06|nr:calmodulin-A-like isoform X2 [Mercenaria mercenaria]